MGNEVINALNWLYSNGNLTEDEFNILKKYYGNDKRDIEVVINELKNFYLSKKAVLDKVASIKNSISDFENIEVIDVLEPVKKVSLTNVSDLHKDGKNYIKLNYADGSIRIVENNLDLPGEDLFNMLMERYSGQEKYDVTTLFEEMTKSAIEVRLYNFNDLSNKSVYDKLNVRQQQDIYIVRSTYPDKQIISGPNDNIYIIREVGSDDIFVKVEMRDGVYQVLPIVNQVINEDSGVYDNSSDSANSIGMSKSKQKTLGANGIPKMYEEGFMNVLFFIFFSGVGIGIVAMAVLNFIVR